MHRIILASGSPRRRQLLNQIGIPHEVIVSGADETIDGPPDMQVKDLALRKANAVCNNLNDDAVIIAADTLVYIDGNVLGKPACCDEAFAMLKTLQGRCHTVYTGVAVLRVDAGVISQQIFVETANVYFRELMDEEILAYINTGEPFDKAGAYGVQDRGALLVDRVDGDYFTVVGLPVARLGVALREMGVEVWQK